MGSSRAFFFVAIAAAAGAFLANVASCSSFDGEQQDAGDDGASANDGSSSGDAPSTQDAGPVDASATVSPLCPPPKGPTSAPETRQKRILYTPPKPTFPFGIVADTTHVTWIEQSAVPDAGSPYDGFAAAKVLRVPKTGGGAKVLAVDQRSAIAVAVDGAFAYWTTWAGGVATLLRAPLGGSCEDSACPPPEVVTTFPPNVRVSSFFRYASETFVASGDDGQVFFVEGKKMPVRIMGTGYYPGLALTSTHLYASTETGKTILDRATVSANPTIDPPYLTIPPEDAGNIGVGHLATDCSSLWMTRYIFGAGAKIYVHDFATPGSFEPITQTMVTIYDLAVDAKYAYAATPNGGVYVVDRINKTPRSLYSGNVFRLAVDGEGVYFGEHAGAQSGTLYMLIKD